MMDYSTIKTIEGISQAGTALIEAAEILHDNDLQIHRNYYRYFIVQTLYNLEDETVKERLEPLLHRYYWNCVEQIKTMRDLIQIIGWNQLLTSTSLPVWNGHN